MGSDHQLAAQVGQVGVDHATGGHRGRLPPVQTDDHVQRLAGRLDEVWRLVLRSVLLVEAALLLATLIVPVLGIDRDPDGSPSMRSTRWSPACRST